MGSFFHLNHAPKPPVTDISKEQVEAIFKRFQEPHTAFIPLHMVYFYGMDPKAVYELRRGHIEEIIFLPETLRILQRQDDRIQRLSRVYGYCPSDKLVVNLRTGQPISHYQTDYISKVIRRDINPSWSWERWRTQKLHGYK